MTLEQTVEYFRDMVEGDGAWELCPCGKDDMEMTIIALRALEKQIPTKPNKSGTRATVCPACNRFIDRHEQKHGNIDIPCCKWCGQALDWSDTK